MEEKKLTMSPERKAALNKVASLDVEGLEVAQEEYGDSWKNCGGIGAYFTIKRPLDRLQILCSRKPADGDGRYDLFAHCVDGSAEGALNAVRDLRRYLALVEAELLLRGHALPLQRHNAIAAERRGDPTDSVRLT